MLTEDDAIDESATLHLRDAMRISRGAPAAFNFSYDPAVKAAAE